jgi:hypothetical protein
MTRYDDAVKCNRCGLERLAATSDLGFVRFENVSSGRIEITAYNEKQFDLCIPCYREFRLFMAEYSKVVGRDKGD